METESVQPTLAYSYKQGKCDGKGSAELNKVGPREDFVMDILNKRSLLCSYIL